MKIYRLSLSIDGEHIGYRYFPNKMEAKKALKQEKKNYITYAEEDFKDSDIACMEIIPRKAEIIKLLNIWASHPDNG